MSYSYKPIIERLSPDRPAVLFLGQKFMTFGDGTDHFLARMSSELRLPGQLANYRELVEELGTRDRNSLSEYMLRLAFAVSLPPALDQLADFPWNAVYMTVPISAVCNAFETSWRQVQPVRNAEYIARGQRNSRKLHLVQIFGDYGVTDSTEQAPFSDDEYEQRLEKAAPRLLDRLESLVTPLGSLIIDGYDPDSDWLEFKRLRARLMEPQMGQVHWFSFPQELQGDTRVKRLIADSKLFCYPESFLEHVAEHWAEMVQSAQESLSLYTTRHTMVVHGKTLAIPEHLWRQLQSTGTVIHKEIGLARESEFSVKTLSSFRRFLKESANSPVWPAHRAAIPFKRAYEDELYHRVLSALRQGSAYEWPIILHGTSATGKTVALAALAYQVGQLEQYPTIYYGPGDDPGDADVIIRFWEDFLVTTEARALLIVWDGMKEIRTYSNMLRKLSKRGLPVVLVGSQYVLKDELKKALPKEIRRSLVEASNALNGSEPQRFLDYLRQYGIDVSRSHRGLKPDERFWVLLYRLSMPELKDQLLHALYGEETRVIDLIQKHLELQAKEAPMTLMAERLAQLFPDLMSNDAQVSAPIHITLTQGQVLIALVMVAAQFGHGVPLELLVRANRSAGGMAASYQDFESILQVQDLIQISSDSKSNLSVTARHRVEATALIKSLTAGPEKEVEWLVTLIEALEKGNWTFDDEVQFISDLLRDVGPRSDTGNDAKYGRYYLDISDALCHIRERKDILHPSLVLKESFFIRHWIRANSPATRTMILSQKKTTIEALLAQAEEALVQVLESDTRVSENERVNLLTERGAVAGFRAIQAGSEAQDSQAVRKLFWEVWPHLSNAIKLNPLNYHPVDVMEWVGRDMLPLLTNEEERATVTKQVWEALDRVNPEDLPQDQMAMYYQAREDFSRATGKNPVDPAVYDRMIEAGNFVGLYCKAWAMVSDFRITAETDKNAEVSVEQRKVEGTVFNFLWGHRELAAQDIGCLNLMRRSWWVSRTGTRLMRGEKQRLNLTRSDWQELLSILRLYDATNMDQAHLIYYLQGLAYWHMREPVEGDRCFELARQNARRYVEGLGSIRRYHILCDQQGGPQEFTGIVRELDESKARGMVEVAGMGHWIPFKMSRGNFRIPGLIVGDSLGRFYIAFNYEGAIADPPGYVIKGDIDEAVDSDKPR